MVLNTKLANIAVLTALVIASIAAEAISPRKGSHGPTWRPRYVNPSPTSIAAGQSVTLTASSDTAATDDTTVNISLTGSRLSALATVTIPAGNSSVSFSVTASASGSTESDTVTASTSAGSASGVVNVTSR